MLHLLDLHFLNRANTIASFLLETEDGPYLFETGPYSTYSYLTSALKEKGYAPGDIRKVFLTHIHLDHAGAAWALAAEGATVYVHPQGYKHLQDPSKLMASATRIYGDEMDRLWGRMEAIPMENLQAVAHEQVFPTQEYLIKAWHTPGHAVHHIAWQVNDVLIAGDVAGVKIGQGPVVPPCPPPDIHIEFWQHSIELMRQLTLNTLFLTHYGAIEKAAIPAHLDALEAELLSWANWIKPYYDQQADPDWLTPKFQAFVQDALVKRGVDAADLELYENANPSWMSVAGLLRYWSKKG
ncbi:MAG TPA: MBL fold metallo-hydrolase [Saprospiraceae bacterium]|nr:MBL fold metallo-hydrolase [Saprospiraceae bacterium]HMQ82137.1 MBL fold metallo-hydrolase [Saprospiraceae bacterium]